MWSWGRFPTARPSYPPTGPSCASAGWGDGRERWPWRWPAPGSTSATSTAACWPGRRPAIPSSAGPATRAGSSDPAYRTAMTVYLDDWRQPAHLGPVDDRWSHLVADTDEELQDR